MRTTLTLDPDVEARLRQLQAKRRVRWKQLVNEALREGVCHLSEQGTESSNEAFETHEADLGRCRYDNLDNVAEVLAVAEGENYR